MTPRERNEFDLQVEQVISGLPGMVLRFLDETPLVVEDHPSNEVMDEMDVECRDELCGLHWGVSLRDRSVDQPSGPADAVLIYREGILAEAADDEGRVDPAELRRQIRITILHEYGHHVGLSEEELEALGYG